MYSIARMRCEMMINGCIDHGHFSHHTIDRMGKSWWWMLFWYVMLCRVVSCRSMACSIFAMKQLNELFENCNVRNAFRSYTVNATATTSYWVHYSHITIQCDSDGFHWIASNAFEIPRNLFFIIRVNANITKWAFSISSNSRDFPSLWHFR